MAPKTPFDDDLAVYLDRVKRESLHPSAQLSQQVSDAKIKIEITADQARKKIRHHLNPEESGSIYLDELEKIHAAINQGEVERRKVAEDKVKTLSDRFWVFVIGVATIVVAAGIVWGFSAVMDAHDKILRDATPIHREESK